MNILERTRYSGNATLKSDNTALCKWFNRLPRKTIELKPQLRKVHDTIDFDDDISKLISEYMYGIDRYKNNV